MRMIMLATGIDPKMWLDKVWVALLDLSQLVQDLVKLLVRF